jgi:carbon-monoxide dehydrogenase large subunit
MTAASVPVAGRLARREDARLLAGAAEYVADVAAPDALEAVIVRSFVPHGIVRGVALDAARAAPGVVDAFAAGDIADYLAPLPARFPPPAGLETLLQLPLAQDRVRYVGEPVAVVVARSRYLAEDAAQLVEADIEMLPAVPDVEAGVADGAPRLHEGLDNLVHTLEFGTGDVDRALQGADVVVSDRLRLHRHGAIPLEGRGLLASFDPASRSLSVWGPTKMPHYHRDALAHALRLDPGAVRIRTVDVGGGFGVRGEFHPEDLLVPIASIRSGRPVRWLEDRSEHLAAVDQSREQHWHATAGVAADGTILALDARVLVDLGGYLRTLPFLVPTLSGLGFLGPYRVAHCRCILDCVVTNKPGIGPVRSPGRYEATSARERLLDVVATRLGIDPVELRLRNLVRPTEMPYDTGIPGGNGRSIVYDGGDYPRALLAAADAVGWPEPPPAPPRRRTGVGVAAFNEGTGIGPYEAARIRWEPGSGFVVATGSTAMGQGHATTLARIAADELRVAPEQVEVVLGDTSLTPDGIGTFASRTTLMAGSAVVLAARRLRERLDVEGDDEPIEEEARFESDREAFSYGAAAAVVELDEELGTVRVLRYVIAADVGNVLQPEIVKGQLEGGAVQGISATLLEELAYSEDGQPLATTFADYLLATSDDVPAVETILLQAGPAPDNPLGVRGAGELGLTGAGAAVANAVSRALGGVPIPRFPLKPDLVAELAATSHPPSGGWRTTGARP